MDDRLEAMKRAFIAGDVSLAAPLANMMMRAEQGKAQAHDQFFSIPTIGTELILLAPWTFTLHAEHRNHALWKLYDPELKDYHGDSTMVIRFPAGTHMKVARIYIRNGQKDYDSVTFSVIKCPAKTPEGKKIKGRFWAKLHDVNRAIVRFEAGMPLSEEPEYQEPEKFTPSETEIEEFKLTRLTYLREVDRNLVTVLEKVFHNGRIEHGDDLTGWGNQIRRTNFWVADKEAQVQDLCKLSYGELIAFKGIGAGAIKKIEDRLALYGLKLRDKGKRGSRTKKTTYSKHEKKVRDPGSSWGGHFYHTWTPESFADHQKEVRNKYRAPVYP